MKWLKEHWFRLGILIACLIVAGSACYYFVVYIPNRDTAERNQEAIDADTVQLEQNIQKNKEAQALQECLNQADVDRASLVSQDCVIEGSASDCSSLSSYHVNEIDSEINTEKDLCFKQFPQN